MSDSSGTNRGPKDPQQEGRRRFSRIFHPDIYPGWQITASPEERASMLRNVEKYFATRVVHAKGPNLPLLKWHDAANFAPVYPFDGKDRTLAEFNSRNFTSGLLVLKDDKIVYEYYGPGASPKSRFHSFSVAKSFTSTLVGIAIQNRLIESVNDPLTRYAPFLTGSPWDGISVKNTLQMLAGIDFGDINETGVAYNIDSRVQYESMAEQRHRFVEAAPGLKRLYPVGQKWYYSSMNYAVLGAVLENATRRRVADFMEKELWQPCGMESDAIWGLDGPPAIGRENTCTVFAATLRDYARFGLLMLHQGKLDRKQILSSEWLKAATTADSAPIRRGSLFMGNDLIPYSAYGYGWWLWDDEVFAAEGVFGQFICIAPKERVVMAKFSYWPEEWPLKTAEEFRAFFKAVRKALADK